MTFVSNIITSLINQLDNYDEGIRSEDEGDCDGFGFFEYHFEDDDEEDCLSSNSSHDDDDEQEGSDGEEDISMAEGEASPHANNTNPSGETPNTAPSMPFPSRKSSGMVSSMLDLRMKESTGVEKYAILIASRHIMGCAQKRLCCSSEISSRNTLR